MIRKKLYTVYLFFFILNIRLFSQVGDCSIPEPPRLTLVSVPDSAMVELRWQPSVSTNISANIIYQYDKLQSGWMALDTLDPEITSHIFRNAGTIHDSMSFRIAAYRSPLIEGHAGCTSKLSNVLNTIFLEAHPDTCLRQVSLKWNQYKGQVTGYNILVSENGTVQETITLSHDLHGYTVTNINSDSEYSFLIRATTLEGLPSASNVVNIYTRMQKPPDWINADYASVTDAGISLSFSIDPLSELTSFKLERRSDNEDWSLLKNVVSENSNISFVDNKSEITTINYYRLSAINGCNLPVIYSNMTSNIVPDLEASEDNLLLKWNNPGRLTLSNLSYNLFINTGSGFSNYASSVDTSYILRLSDLTHLAVGIDICFYIKALETNNPFDINSIINSATICYIPEEIITVPNLFTPDNDGLNDYFYPVLSFTPSEYLIVVTDRQGNVVFESRDHFERWDGTFNGIKQNEGVYLWRLKLKTPAGNTVFRTGTITITF